jgi:hypothetical protein
MIIWFMWKDAASGGGGCASLSRAEKDGRPGYVVNGVLLDEADRAQIPHLSEGEAAVWVPANVLDRLRETA